MITKSLVFLRHTAIVYASSTKLVCMRVPMLQPTTARESKSNTAAKYNQPSCVRLYLISVTQAWSGSSCLKWRCNCFGAT
jgi:hypothetical protein